MGFLSSVFRNALPFFFYKYLYIIWPERRRQREREKVEGATLEYKRAMTTRNRDLHGLHRGSRAFILCNGPSVKRQDIRPLKDELVMSVSNGYHHPDYAEIAPAYHCVPQITYGLMTQQDVITWFHEMHRKIGDAVLFLSTNEEALVRENNLFPGRDVRYVNLSGPFSEYPTEDIPDLADRIPGVQSVPIMALLIGMYMGCDRLYLLGTDHDHFLSGEYKYFYEPTILRGKDLSADEHGHRRTGWYEELSALAALWGQYRSVKNIGAANGVSIFNATAGGQLDEFPRVALESLFAGAGSAGAQPVISKRG